MARKRRSRASRAHASADPSADPDHLLGSSLDDSFLDNLLTDLDRLSVSPLTVPAAQQHSSPTTTAGGSSARRRSNRPALHPITSVPTSPAAVAAGIGSTATPFPAPETPPAAASAVPQTPKATGASTKSGKRGRKSANTTPNNHRSPQHLLRPRPVSPSPLPLHPTATFDSDTSDIDPDDPAILAATAAQRRRREQKRAKRSSKRQQHQAQLQPLNAVDNGAVDSDVDLSDTESVVELRMEVEALFVHSQMQVLCPWYLPMFDIVKVEREECAVPGTPEYGTGGLGGFVGARNEQLERLGKWGHPRWDCLVPVPEEGDEWRWVVSIDDE